MDDSSARSTTELARQHATEVERGERFRFGANWASFLRVLDESQILEAIDSLQSMLETKSLAGTRFLDAGCGSGLFSLAARRLGAKVHSFDYDPRSVACTQELKSRYDSVSSEWIIEQASVLDTDYLKQLGRFDTVYSWGVLHHTGQMWHALENLFPAVAPEGRLFISIYNDQGKVSQRWRRIKLAYNKSPAFIRPAILMLGAIRLWWRTMVRDMLLLKPFHTWRTYKKSRGMSPWHDIVDWIGGYPFEVAKPEEILLFCRRQGFELQMLKTCGGGHGCNEYVFRSHRVNPGGNPPCAV